MTDKAFDYQSKTAELDKILASLEGGELDIDEALKVYDKGQAILAELNDYLKNAENKITKLKTK